MAPRVVHFSGFELSYECSQMTICECERDSGWFSTDFRTKAKAASASGQTAFLDRWHMNVTSYSALNITFLKDRLPALSGLAKHEQKSMEILKNPPGQYLAGLWEISLIQDLAWCVGDLPLLVKERPNEDLRTVRKRAAKLQSPFFATITRPVEYVAPTWSWASIRDRVVYLHRFYCQEYIQVLSARTELATVDPTAGVNSGCIVLKGKLMPSRWALVPHYFKGHHPGLYIARPFLPQYFSLVDIKGTRPQFGDAFEDRGMQWLPDYAITTEHLHQLKIDEMVYLLPLAAANASYTKDYETVHLDDNNLTYVFLVLRQVRAIDLERKLLPVFERVGYASLDKTMLRTDEVEEQTFKLI